jgi:hypothetical protein
MAFFILRQLASRSQHQSNQLDDPSPERLGDGCRGDLLGGLIVGIDPKITANGLLIAV